MSAEELNKLKKSLRSVLISCPEGTPITKVEHDYRTFMGCGLSYRQFGFSNIESFLRSVPDTVRLSGPIAFGVACDEIKHVTKLINNQRKVTSNLKKVQRARENSRQAYGPPAPAKYWNAPHPRYHSIVPPPPPIHYQHFNPQPHGPHFPSGYNGRPDPHCPPPMNPQFFAPPPIRPINIVPPPRIQSPPFSPPPVSPASSLPGNEIIFNEKEIVELLTQHKIHYSKPLVHVLSLAFPYIYKGSHLAILDLSIPLCIDLATAIAFDCEEELEGTPAILVCKMQEIHDFKLIESSPNVQRFNLAKFRETTSKVLTINFRDMLNLLNSNNEHFYNSTTFIIFVDLLPAHMPLLENLLPPELQYLFLLTTGRDFVFKLPHIVIRRWGTNFTDVAYKGEKLIERLQDKLAILNPTATPSSLPPPSPTAQQTQPSTQQKPAKLESVANGKPPVRTNGTSPVIAPSYALRHLTEAPYRAKVNLFIQAGPTRGKTSLLLEFALNRVDVTLDKLQIVLTAPNPTSAGQLFLRLKEYVNTKGITEVRAFGYTEGSFDKLNLYITEQKVHVLVIENSHLYSLISKNPDILNHCKLLGCDELYGSFYTKQVPTTVAQCFGKLKLNITQIITVSRPSEKEDLLQVYLPKPFWHIKEEDGNTEHKEKYLVTFFNKC